jgi:hypothetical protein
MALSAAMPIGTNQCHIPSSPGMQLHPIALSAMPASLILPPFA